MSARLMFLVAIALAIVYVLRQHKRLAQLAAQVPCRRRVGRADENAYLHAVLFRIGHLHHFHPTVPTAGGRQETIELVAVLGAADKFEMSYVNVGGAPAQAFIYQPQGSDVVLVWAAKKP